MVAGTLVAGAAIVSGSDPPGTAVPVGFEKVASSSARSTTMSQVKR